MTAKSRPAKRRVVPLIIDQEWQDSDQPTSIWTYRLIFPDRLDLGEARARFIDAIQAFRTEAKDEPPLDYFESGTALDPDTQWSVVTIIDTALPALQEYLRARELRLLLDTRDNTFIAVSDDLPYPTTQEVTS